MRGRRPARRAVRGAGERRLSGATALSPATVRGRTARRPGPARAGTSPATWRASRSSTPGPGRATSSCPRRTSPARSLSYFDIYDRQTNAFVSSFDIADGAWPTVASAPTASRRTPGDLGPSFPKGSSSARTTATPSPHRPPELQADAARPDPPGQLTRGSGGDTVTFLMKQTEHSNAARLARRTVRRLSDATLELTGPVRVRPDFLIVGAQRCGTTSMFKTLVQHPAVVPPVPAQGRALLRQVATSAASGGTAGTSRLAVTRAAAGAAGQPAAHRRVEPVLHVPPARRGSGSRATCPSVKLIVLLRDPVERAYSGHSHELARGFETLSFEDALAAEPERLAGERERLHGRPGVRQRRTGSTTPTSPAASTSSSSSASRSWSAASGMCVVDSGDFFVDPEPVFDEVREFLGLAPCCRTSPSSSTTPGSVAAVRRAAHPTEEHYAPYDDELASGGATRRRGGARRPDPQTRPAHGLGDAGIRVPRRGSAGAVERCVVADDGVVQGDAGDVQDAATDVEADLRPVQGRRALVEEASPRARGFVPVDDRVVHL